jgi:hypothetical protein
MIRVDRMRGERREHHDKDEHDYKEHSLSGHGSLAYRVDLGQSEVAVSKVGGLTSPFCALFMLMALHPGMGSSAPIITKHFANHLGVQLCKWLINCQPSHHRLSGDTA